MKKKPRVSPGLLPVSQGLSARKFSEDKGEGNALTPLLEINVFVSILVRTGIAGMAHSDVLRRTFRFLKLARDPTSSLLTWFPFAAHMA